MSIQTAKKRGARAAAKAVSEILILPDGRVLAHNISPGMAGLLVKLEPANEAMNRRATAANSFKK